jgi:hypothetical protein
MLALFADLLTFLGIIVPVVQTVLFIRIDMPLLFFAATGYSQGTYKNKRNMQSASSAHNSLSRKKAF